MSLAALGRRIARGVAGRGITRWRITAALGMGAAVVPRIGSATAPAGVVASIGSAAAATTTTTTACSSVVAGVMTAAAAAAACSAAAAAAGSGAAAARAPAATTARVLTRVGAAVVRTASRHTDSRGGGSHK